MFPFCYHSCMPKRSLLTMLLVILFATACSAQPTMPVEQDAPTAPASQPEPVEPNPEPAQEIESPSTQEASPEVESVASDCSDGEISLIGQSIAEEYDFTSYEEVIIWFCNGAEFEDILVALETESQTDNSAEEMLQMLADGFTWEEIWQLEGLTD